MFTTTNLAGFGGKSRGPLGALTLTYVGSSVDGTNATDFTFTDHAIGTAASDRLVIVGVIYQNNGDTAATAPTSLTIGGSPATIHGSQLGTGTNECGITIASKVVPSGTTATIAFGFAEDMVRAGVVVYTLTGWTRQTPAAMDGQINSPETTTRVENTFTVGLNQIGIYVTHNNDNGLRTCTFSNATQNVDTVFEASLANYASATIFTSVGIPMLVRADWTGTTASIVGYGAIWE